MHDRVFSVFETSEFVIVASHNPILMGGTDRIPEAGGGAVTGGLPFCVCIAEGSRSAERKRSSEMVTRSLPSMKDRVQPSPNSREKLPRGCTTYARPTKASFAATAAPPDSDSILRMTKSVSSPRALRLHAAVAVLLGLLLSFGAQSALAQASSSPDDGPLQPSNDVSKPHFLDNATIIKMSKAGLDDTVIIQTIQTQPGRYDTTPDDLISLKNAGVSQQVIAAMQARSAGLVFHAKEKIAPAPLAAGIDEIGVYYQDKKTGEWLPLKTERVEFKSSGWLKNAATDGLIKQDMNGHLEGDKSPLVLPTGVNILIYAPPGTQA